MKKVTLFFIKSYQKYVSVNLGAHCRFHPTCSEFTYQAVTKYGTIKGLFLGLTRIARCHPFTKGGFDPVK